MAGKAKGEEMELRQVLVALGKGWGEQEEKLKERLLAEGVCYVRFDRGQMRPEDISAANTIVLTDDRTLAGELAGRGVVCVGCAAEEDRFFEGAALVTDAPETLEARVLEEYLLRATGRPVTIAVTERLVIREITERDLPGFCRIGEHSEAYQDPEDIGGNCFEPERMRAYIRNAYRFYGYGLWSVLLRDGTLVGCCGFADFAGWNNEKKRVANREGEKGEKTEKPFKSLELQYIVAAGFRRRGYGEEMCSAALLYAHEYLCTDEIWVRVKNGNYASEALARKLGFAIVSISNNRILMRLGKKPDPVF